MPVLLTHISLNCFGEAHIQLPKVNTYFHLCVTEKCFQWLLMVSE